MDLAGSGGPLARPRCAETMIPDPSSEGAFVHGGISHNLPSTTDWGAFRPGLSFEGRSMPGDGSDPCRHLHTQGWVVIFANNH